MKSLEIIKEVEEDVRKYGIVNNLFFTLEKIIQIERDLEMVKFLKEHYGITYYDPNNPYLYHMVINLSTNKEYEKLVKWLNEDIL